MKQFRYITTLSLAALFALSMTGAASARPILTVAAPKLPVSEAARQTPARTLSSSQELTVTAVVPAHRDIIVDNRGKILTITSNTLEDITPKVFLGSVTPENEQVLTPELLQEYRRLVPENTAQYGKLYEASLQARLGLLQAGPAWR